MEGEEINTKVRSMQIEIGKYLSKGQDFINRAHALLDPKILAYESERVLTETWIHVDMDMFYAAVEIRDNPALADKPLAVGTNGMLTTANYIAREYKIHSGMPGYIALRLCPDLMIIPPNFEKYHLVAEQIRNIFREYDPKFETQGLDEAYLLVTPMLKESESDTETGRNGLAQEIRDRIYQETKLTCSAGIACNKLLAKICSDMNKPNGQCYLPPDREAIIDFMQKLNVRKVPKIGSVLEKVLNGIGIYTCGDILKNKLSLSVTVTESTFQFLLKSALGIGDVQHSEAEDQKSVSISRTFPATDNLGELMDKLKNYSQALSDELGILDAESRHITVNVKTYKYETKTRSEGLKKYISSCEDIFQVAKKQLEALNIDEPIRLLGIKASALAHGKTKRKSIKTYLGEQSKKTAGEKAKRLAKKDEFVHSMLFNSLTPETNQVEQNLSLKELNELAYKPTEKVPTPVKVSKELPSIPQDIPISSPTTASNTPAKPEIESVYTDILISKPSQISEVTQYKEPVLSEELKDNKSKLKAKLMQCPICGKWYEFTEYMMSKHIEGCIEKKETLKRKAKELPVEKRPRKRNKMSNYR